MKFVFLSDTHGKHDQVSVPESDFFIFCGDMCSRGRLSEVESFASFLERLPHKYKIVIAGNHDFPFEGKHGNKSEEIIKKTGAIYLNDTGIEVEGFKFWGSPVQPRFYDWAFNRKRGEEIKYHWDLIPHNTDILITHGPPFGILDRVKSGENVGCEELRKKTNKLKLKVHAFGHIHEEPGIREIEGTTYVNASSLDLNYQYRNKPIELEI